MTQSLAQRAAFLCRTESFRRWLDRRRGYVDRTHDEAMAAEWLRNACKVSSRSEITPGSYAECMLYKIEREYRRELAEEVA